MLDLLWPPIPSLPEKAPKPSVFPGLFLIILQHQLRDRANKLHVFFSKKLSILLFLFCLISGGWYEVCVRGRRAPRLKFWLPWQPAAHITYLINYNVYRAKFNWVTICVYLSLSLHLIPSPCLLPPCSCSVWSYRWTQPPTKEFIYVWDAFFSENFPVLKRQERLTDHCRF